jgi:cell division protein FtsB
MFWKVFLVTALGVLNVALFSRMVWSPYGLLVYHKLRQEHIQLEAQILELDKQNLALSHEIRLLRSDNSYVEKMIRRRLHYVKDNEILYLFHEVQSSSKAGAPADAGQN